ncbi:VOC family protein [Cellulomonas sp. KRMCY2]|uniref:VOC family protein n=1 Tax=Cellulomonas sp. KRMCY2 TaxID=1304865 RepID=UPI00045E65EA|nr:VOC family protein [Cellulomonas sp. KRMCY2]
MQAITPFLWFDDQAEEAAQHYVSIFENSRILDVSRNGEGGPGPAGSVLTVRFELDGLELQALNGGPHFHFTEAISLFVSVESQEEVDRLWDRLIEGGGEPSRCGWLKDRYGLSWQVVPTALSELMGDPDPARASRATQAMLGMSKIDIAALRAAADGVPPVQV